MNPYTRTCRAIAVAAFVLGVGGVGHAQTPDADAALTARIAELENKSSRDDDRIAALERRLTSLDAADRNWLTYRRAEEIRTIVEDVLADADTRTSTLGNITAGYRDGAVISSKNGDSKLRTNFFLQPRFVLNSQSNSPDDPSIWGFEVARAKFILSGTVVSREWFYLMSIELGGVNVDLPNGESRTGLLEAYAGYDFDNGWKATVGTFKMPVLREELVDARYQLAVERSVTNYLYTAGYTDGLTVEYTGDKLHFVGSFNNGMNDDLYGGTIMTGGTSIITGAIADFAVSARVEWLFDGEWDQFKDFTSPKGSDRAMMFGGAILVQTGSDNIDLLVFTADFSGEFDGWNVFGALTFTRADGPGLSVSPLALVAQGGYYLADDLEAFARFEWSDTDTLFTDNLLIVTGGVTKYFERHNAKWTTDIGFGLEPVPVTVPITDWRADSAGSSGQFVIRSQLQLAF